MSFVISLRMPGVAGLTEDLRCVVLSASRQMGQIVEIPEKVAGRMGDELTAHAVKDVLAVRRRERSVTADVLALHLG